MHAALLINGVKIFCMIAAVPCAMGLLRAAAKRLRGKP